MELAVQQYLRKSGNTLKSLTDNLGIKVYEHPILPLVGLKYSQINSPKTNPIVRDCRGIVLEKYSWQVVAKTFRRFFNYGEDISNCKFDWSNFTTTTKEDGSLMIVYNYNGRWHVNTSGSFGLAECNFSGKTWRELFWETSGIDQNRLNPSLTYIFEMWTPYNKVLRVYPAPFVSLLGAFYNPNLQELPENVVDELAEEIKVGRPERHHLTSAADINSFLQTRSKTDKTFEGVVVRDCNNERLKIKSQTYVAMHGMTNGNAFSPKNIIPILLAGELDEFVVYFPEAKEFAKKHQRVINEEFEKLSQVWENNYRIVDQKEFAQSVVKATPFSSLLFQLRRQKGENQKIDDLKFIWENSQDLILKVLNEKMSRV